MLSRILKSNIKKTDTTLAFNKSLTTQINHTIKYKTHIPTLSKTSQLRTLLYDKKTHYGMEAHNGMSARIAQEEKFEFIWGSGLCISAAQAVPDANQLSSSEVVTLTKYIAQAVNIPVLLDMDTGYGNFNNAMCTVRDMEAAGIAGGCIEDKLFPKVNSFIGDGQELADVGEFCGKIRACQDSKYDANFVIVARCESLISGRGVKDALFRAEKYRQAGADAILIHSKKDTFDEIKEWLHVWERRLPVIIVPTKYAEKTPVGTWEKENINLVIWANHSLRTAIPAMRNTCRHLKETGNLKTLKGTVSVDEVFRLTGEAELKQMENLYVPKVQVDTKQAKSEDQSYVKKTSKLDVEKLVDQFESEGVSFITGVPDSNLKELTQEMTKRDTFRHIVAANEGAALALAIGHNLATSKVPLVYLQNSGIGNLVNPVISIAHQNVYSIPMVLCIGWRGEPNMWPKKDEPQHIVQGKITVEMLHLLGIPTIIAPQNTGDALNAISEAFAMARDLSQPVCLLFKPDIFEASKNNIVSSPFSGPNYITRRSAIEVIDRVANPTNNDGTCNWARFCATGKSSRELYEVSIASRNKCSDWLSVGGMGHLLSTASGFALGLSTFNQDKKKILCIDGDGSMIMHMGSLSIINEDGLQNLLHIVINNGLHDSVGSHATVAQPGTKFNVKEIAKSVGYEQVFSLHTAADLENVIKQFENSKERKGAWFVEMQVATDPSTESLSRPKETPVQRKQLFLEQVDFSKKQV